MKKTMLTTLAAVSVMISVLTGCGGSGIAGTAAAPAEKASEAPAAPAQPAPAAAEGKKVRVAIVQPMTHTSLDQIRETIIANLAEDPGIEIVTQIHPPEPEERKDRHHRSHRHLHGPDSQSGL